MMYVIRTDLAQILQATFVSFSLNWQNNKKRKSVTTNVVQTHLSRPCFLRSGVILQMPTAISCNIRKNKPYLLVNVSSSVTSTSKFKSSYSCLIVLAFWVCESKMQWSLDQSPYGLITAERKSIANTPAISVYNLVKFSLTFSINSNSD